MLCSSFTVPGHNCCLCCCHWRVVFPLVLLQARTVGKPSLPSTLRYGWCKLLEHMMHGDDTKRFQLEDVLGTMLLWEHNPAEFGFFMAETVDAIKDAKDEKTPEWQMRRRLDCGGGSSSSSRDNNISQLAFSGVDLKVGSVSTSRDDFCLLLSCFDQLLLCCML